MNKLEMAHEYAMVRLTTSNQKTLDEIIQLSWYYADAMQKEWDEREDKDCPSVLNLSNSKPLEWQPDWSQAPAGYDWWASDKNGESYFYSYEPYLHDEYDYWGDFDNTSNGSAKYTDGNFNYIGNWKDSLRKRP